MTLETSIDDVIPGLTLELKSTKKSDKLSGNLSGTYKHPSATLTGELDIVNIGSLKASVCSGADAVSVGGDVSVDKGVLSDFSVGLGIYLYSCLLLFWS